MGNNLPSSISDSTLVTWIGSLAGEPIGYSSDSRSAQQKIFVAMKGEKTDGHDFVESTLKTGAVGAVVERIPAAFGPNDPRFFVTTNVHEVHRALARIFRLRYKGKLIGIGGSSGKTSTKEFLSQILESKFKIFKTDKSQNGELGIPKTLEKLSSDTTLGVIEIGIDAPGDMIRHATLVEPDIAVLTSIGEEHLNLLKDVENVFKEEKILFDITIKRNGHCFAPEGDTYLSRLNGTHQNLHLTPAQSTRFQLPFTHPHAVQNALLAAAVAQFCGMSDEEINAALKKLVLPEGRGRELDCAQNTLVIADHYNANPSSIRAGIGHARALAEKSKRPLTMILGDMLDLGDACDELHLSLVNELKNQKESTYVLIGPSFQKAAKTSGFTKALFYADSLEAAKNLDHFAKASGQIYLVKGSRGMKLENVLKPLLKKYGNNESV